MTSHELESSVVSCFGGQANGVFANHRFRAVLGRETVPKRARATVARKRAAGAG